MANRRFHLFFKIFLLLWVSQLIGFNLNAESDFSLLFEPGKKQSLNNNIKILAELSPGTSENTIVLKLWGRIDNGYYIYSVFPQGDFSPEPTQVFLDTPLLVPDKEISESKTISVEDQAFEQKLNVHQYDFWIEQQYRIAESSKLSNQNIVGSLLYQICNKRICSLPLTKSFKISIY